MRDSTERLRDMLEAIARIERDAARSRKAFEQDELILVWIFHHPERRASWLTPRVERRWEALESFVSGEDSCITGGRWKRHGNSSFSLPQVKNHATNF